MWVSQEYLQLFRSGLEMIQISQDLNNLPRILRAELSKEKLADFVTQKLVEWLAIFALATATLEAFRADLPR